MDHDYPDADPERLEDLGTPGLNYRRRLLLEAIDRITAQLDRAKAQAAETGAAPDPDWLIRAEDALRHKERGLHDVEEVLQERKRKQELHLQHTFAVTFVNVARRRLPSMLFGEIDLQAKAEMERPGASAEYDARLKRRRRLHEEARARAEEEAERAAAKTADVQAVQAQGEQLKAARAVCVAAEELVALWSAGEPVGVHYYERLADAVKDWSFKRDDGRPSRR